MAIQYGRNTMPRLRRYQQVIEALRDRLAVPVLRTRILPSAMLGMPVRQSCRRTADAGPPVVVRVVRSAQQRVHDAE
jgi:hypothetical protein